jgi:cation transport ATPase
MIGDGFNDSGALAGADLGIAVGAGPSRLLAEGADLTLLGDPVQQLPEVQKLSQLLVTAIRGNLTFAVLYNALAIPLALLGLLNPLLAAVAMFASSLTVIGNTQRLAREGKVEVPGRQHGVLLTEALAEHQVTFPRFSGHRVRLQV